ncbi:MAG: NAD(P)/FAD-dependent oxidoreductase [Oscillospiraceae bacterium]|nr:NAD(P)/FAD-dependent oxidoreductase [Oscillospiraceae bacterium]
MYDVAIVGAGIIGACVARKLSGYAIKTVVIEKDSDVGTGCTRANSGIVHGGYDAKPGSLKAKYNVLGQKMYDRLAKELRFPFKRNGSLVIAFDEKDIPRLEQLKEQGVENGLLDLRIAHKDELKELEPNLSENVYAALVVPAGGIVSPYEMAIAFAENAAQNGVEFMLDSEATSIDKKDGYFLISTPKGKVEARIIVNAAGEHSDEINNMLSEHKLKIIPRSGEYCLIDRTEGGLVKHTVFQLPTKMGKGILVTPTAEGNLLIGPTSADIEEKGNTATTMQGLGEVLEKARLSVKRVPINKIITSFCGLRPRTELDEFIIEEAKDVPGLINLCGIESPGLTAAPAIAEEVGRMIAERLNPAENKGFDPIRKITAPFRDMTGDERRAAIKENPDYGHIICRCETVTKAEIIAALRSPLPVRSLDAIKRRTRAGMGRCQAGFCSMRLLDIIAEECGISITDVTKSGGGSNILIERNKTSI